MRDTDNISRAQIPPLGDARRGGPAAAAGEGPAAERPYPVNERPYRRFADPGEPLRVLGRPAERPRDDEGPGYVIHLPVRVADLAAATALAGTVAVSLGFLRELDAGETTVSTADDQNNRHRVFCDLLLPDRSRCPQPYDHEGACGEPPSGR
ncbi:hypothetical protein ACFY2R_08545 [Micromonospora olivasterospora]|uniref:Uncharacterized protein n=1 Tax=Micromonospora olivasterospora TaxID=1880 RepID=A0A562I7N7_MICOL|nr:hypothetical protein [Micromonospora olivasterospora]TWH67027.1 hypothetical protein JD77_01988 [Micromonospora olivasterospora]